MPQFRCRHAITYGQTNVSGDPDPEPSTLSLSPKLSSRSKASIQRVRDALGSGIFRCCWKGLPRVWSGQSSVENIAPPHPIYKFVCPAIGPGSQKQREWTYELRAGAVVASLETTGVLLHSMPSRGRSKWGGWLAKVQTSEARLPRRVRRIAQPRLCRRHIKLEGGLLGERRNMWSIAVTPSHGLVLRIFTHRKQLPRALNPKPLAAKEVFQTGISLSYRVDQLPVLPGAASA